MRHILHPKISLIRNRWLSTQLNKHNASSSLITKSLHGSAFDDCSYVEQRVFKRWQHSAGCIPGTVSTAKRGCIPATTSTRNWSRIIATSLHSHCTNIPISNHPLHCFSSRSISQTTDQSRPDTSNTKGKPTEEHLETVFKSLNHSLPRFFVQPHDYSIYSPHVIFENNIRGVTTKDLFSYVRQLSWVRIVGHFKFAHVRMEVLKITQHVEDGTIRVQWRMRGISGLKMIFNLWKMRPWKWREMYAKEAE